MDAYIYRADIFCVDCGERRKEALKVDCGCCGGRHADIGRIDCRAFYPPGLKGQTADPEEHLYDSDEYPKGPFPAGEADTPQHCGSCGLFLENPLTQEGREYVLAEILDAVKQRKGASVAIETWGPFYLL